MGKTESLDELIRRVNESLRNDPRWQAMAGGRDWICPYCGQVGVFRMRRSQAVGDVINHLRMKCPKWDQGRGRLMSLAEIRAAVRSRELRGRKATQQYSAAPTLRVAVGRRLGTSARPSAETTAETQRLREELLRLKEQSQEVDEGLEQARRIVAQMLPEEVPVLGDADLSFGYYPSLKIGGDFYDFIDAGPGRIGILIGDVSGHGLDAALLMSMARKALALRGSENPSPANVLRLANADVYQDLGERRFITAFYAVVDVREHTLAFARAGHNAPLIYSPSRQSPFGLLKSEGIALGIDPGPLFNQRLEEKRTTLRPHDVVVFYTDGVTEAKNARQEAFRVDGVCAVLQKHAGASSEQIVNAVFEAVQRHTQGVEQEDDMALICLSIRPSRIEEKG